MLFTDRLRLDFAVNGSSSSIVFLPTRYQPLTGSEVTMDYEKVSYPPPFALHITHTFFCSPSSCMCFVCACIFCCMLQEIRTLLQSLKKIYNDLTGLLTSSYWPNFQRSSSYRQLLATQQAVFQATVTPTVAQSVVNRQAFTSG